MADNDAAKNADILTTALTALNKVNKLDDDNVKMLKLAERIDRNKRYKVNKVDEKGNIIPNETEIRNGHELQDSLLLTAAFQNKAKLNDNEKMALNRTIYDSKHPNGPQGDADVLAKGRERISEAVRDLKRTEGLELMPVPEQLKQLPQHKDSQFLKSVLTMAHVDTIGSADVALPRIKKITELSNA